MNYLILILIFLINPVTKSKDCNVYYTNNVFSDVSINGKISEKKEAQEIYTFSVEKENGEIQTIDLYKNNKSILIYQFAEKGDLMVKDKGKLVIRIAHFGLNERISVRIFSELCT